MKINSETHYLWRTVDNEDEMLESFVTKHRDHLAALKLLGKIMKRRGYSHVLITDKLHFHGAAMKVICNADRQEVGRWLTNRAENSKLPFQRGERVILRFR